MKLPELKKYFNNKYVIRIVAGVLVVTMVGTGVTIHGLNDAHGNQNVSEQVVVSNVEEVDDVINAAEGSEEKLTDALNSSLKINEVDIGKEETVYVIAESNGKKTNTIVSDHLINQDDKATIEDASDLENITNVKGDESFTQNGNAITWQADGNDIYYQGTTEKEIPITQNITYYLDGKEIAPEELAGKSGKVTIHFDYTNNQKVKTEIGGKEEEICVPFMALTGMIFDDRFTDIEVTNGKVVADGNSNIVIGYALPGLKESLDVEDSDFDSDVSIPDSFEVTAKVEDFSLEMTMTVAMNATNFISMDSNGATSSVEDLLDTLTDATRQLEDGSGDLADGVDTLNSKMGEFSNGVLSLKDAVTAYTDGADTLNAGIGTLKTGIDTLADNVPALISGVGQLKTGSDSAAEGAKSLASGAAQVSAGVNTLAETIQNMGATLEASKTGVYANFSNTAGMEYDKAKEVIASLQQAQERLEQVIELDVQATDALAGGNSQTYTAMKSKITAAYSGIEAQLAASGINVKVTNAAEAANAIDTIGDTIAALQNGIGQVDGAVSAINQVEANLTGGDSANQLAALTKGAADVAKGASDLSDGVGALQSGISQLNEKAGTLGSGATQLKDGAAQLADGAATLVANNEALKSGASAVCEATGQLSEGVSTLKDGAHQLSDGIVEFNESGIEKVVNAYNGDVKPLIERMQAVIDAGADYQTYTDIADGVNGSVKFIYKTAAVK